MLPSLVSNSINPASNSYYMQRGETRAVKTYRIEEIVWVAEQVCKWRWLKGGCLLKSGSGEHTVPATARTFIKVGIPNDVPSLQT